MATKRSTAALAFESATLAKYGAVMAKPYIVSDIVPGYLGSTNSYLTSVNGTLYFFTSFNLEGDYYQDFLGIRLWKSDGTKAGTVAVKDIFPLFFKDAEPQGLTSFNGIFYFLANNDGYKLWKSDGTPEGTVDVVGLTGDRNTSPTLLANINGTLYFSVINTNNYYEEEYHYDLWKSDGTEEGTFKVKEFDSFVGIASSINVNGTLYFTTNQYSEDEEGNYFEQITLWESNGTTAGTVPFKEFNIDGYLYNLTQVSNIFYFTINNYSDSNELWKSDGTTQGTVKVKDINASYLRNFNNTLYFIADDVTHGKELWKSDGTTAGTVLVKDIRSGKSSSFTDIYSITNVDDILYFIADDGIHGGELWKSDGTTAGTVLVKDINSGAGSSKISGLTNVDDILYFIADDGIHGG
ncbi:ELWxxDGT repeat protein, partial [Halotia wernerae UHCC 0503]|nr:ELWxxDGT repeat protein [Halotia wernerae UHCC 0503]